MRRNDPRLAVVGKNMPAVIPAVPSVPVIPSIKTDPRIEKSNDFRDPRLLQSCPKFPPDVPFPYQMATAATAVSLPQSIVPMLSVKEPNSLRKVDPRLRFRANQNA